MAVLQELQNFFSNSHFQILTTENLLCLSLFTVIFAFFSNQGFAKDGVMCHTPSHARRCETECDTYIRLSCIRYHQITYNNSL